MRRGHYHNDIKSGKGFLAIAGAVAIFAWICAGPGWALCNPLTLFYGIFGLAFLVRGNK
jgi:hypothetical protein